MNETKFQRQTSLDIFIVFISLTANLNTVGKIRDKEEYEEASMVVGNRIKCLKICFFDKTILLVE